VKQKTKSILAIVFLVLGIASAAWMCYYAFLAIREVIYLSSARGEQPCWDCMLPYIIYCAVAAMIALSAVIAFFVLFGKFRKFNHHLRLHE
jgi:hypothetical protein